MEQYGKTMGVKRENQKVENTLLPTIEKVNKLVGCIAFVESIEIL